MSLTELSGAMCFRQLGWIYRYIFKRSSGSKGVACEFVLIGTKAYMWDCGTISRVVRSSRRIPDETKLRHGAAVMVNAKIVIGRT